MEVQIGISGLPVFSYSNGYLGVMVDGKRVAEHRYIMERELGRPLTRAEIVHHKDFNKRNNHPSNLLLTNNSAHMKWHNKAYRYRNCMHLLKSELKDERDKTVSPYPKSPGRPRKKV